MNRVAGAGRRVALVLGSSTGGVGRHVASLAAGLVADGVAVTVCGPAATESQFGFERVGARFVAVEIPAAPGLADAGSVRALRSVLRVDGAVDVVHAHGLRAGLVASLARPPGRPLVVTWHNLSLAAGLRGEVYRHLERYTARAADVTLGVSPDLVQRARHYGARDARLAVVPAPARQPPVRRPDEVREEFGVEPGQPLVLAVGRLHPQKGHDTLIAAAASWRHRVPPPAVVVAGSGPEYLRLASLVSVSEAPVRLLGHREDIPDLLAAADVVVSTSIWEGNPLFLQEAIRAGAPLVATAVGGVPDLVGDAAILVPPRDADAVDVAVSRLLDDPGLREEYARRGRARAATWPTEADAVASVEALYTELTRTRTPERR
ncbi:MAG TPA: glycosyltransferase family 4 protein [Micromonosporaceae bacterium]|nr:glycosyltransferase family 4 protein [Micromonosporaceae bacterium]